MATQAALKQEDTIALQPELPPLRKQLVETVFDPDKAFNMSEAELQPLRLAAAQELFLTRIAQIPLLKKRAEDAGITQRSILPVTVPTADGTKIVSRDEGLRRETTLERLRCDVLDLYQLHAVTDLDELDRRGEAIEVLLEAREPPLQAG